MDLGDQTPIVRLGGKRLYLLGHLSGLESRFYKALLPVILMANRLGKLSVEDLSAFLG